VRLKVAGPAGTRVVIRHGEHLDRQGQLDPWSNRDAMATDVYIKGSDDAEVWEPRFTYHGFRYVQLSGLTEPLRAEDILGIVLRADARAVAGWSSSDELVNEVYGNFIRGFTSNLMSFPTDCPQRDERTPCQMDSQVVEEFGLLTFDLEAYYRSWLRSILGNPGNPDWAGDQLGLPWFLYQASGDDRPLREAWPLVYEQLRSWAALPMDAFDGFGDWCAPNSGSWDSFFRSPRFVNAALAARFLDQGAAMAKAIGLAADGEELSAMASGFRARFIDFFWDPVAGRFQEHNQTTLVLGLAFGLVPDGCQAGAFRSLLALVDRNRGRLDTGIFGTRYLLEVLADRGQIDRAMAMLMSTSYPGFGDQLLRGATTTWEQWRERGGMHSHNHAMFAGVGASFFTHLAGIRPGSPGYGTIEFRPVPPSSLHQVEAWILTPLGRAATAWERRPDGVLLYEVSLPPGAQGLVYLPGSARGVLVGPGRHIFQTRFP
jgi:alpha-L-rhamnosidase